LDLYPFGGHIRHPDTPIGRLNLRSPDADQMQVGDYDFFAAPPPAAGSGPGVPRPYVAPPATGSAVALTPSEQQMLASGAATSWSHMNNAPSYLAGGRLGFTGSIRVGFQLLPVCWSVLAEQPNLFAVPLLVLCAGVLSVIGYADAFGGLANLAGPNKYAVAVKIFPLAAVVCAVGVVGQAVIVAAATNTLEGRRSSVGTAWMTVAGQLPRLVLFGVLYAGERTITSLLRGRRWSLGTLAANTIDRAWDFATFLTIPVLLYEDRPVFRAVARSGQLVAKRWGVQLTARSVLGLALFVFALPLFILGIVLMATSTALGTAVVIVTLMGMVALSGALTGALSAVLYRFATTGLVAPGFSEAQMWAVFSRR
jgi:hypothetical protein